MRPFRCGTCEQLVFFDNSTCLRCSSALGYLPDDRVLVALAAAPDGDDNRIGVLHPIGSNRGPQRRCANNVVVGCNWLVPADARSTGVDLCASCRLTSLRPSDDDAEAMASLAKAEAAKRRLLDQMTGLGLPIVDRRTDPTHGLTFELLSSRHHSVTTGHHGGVVTLDLSESDDAHREFVRQQLGEPYRTVLGHLRHEIAHYLWPRLVIGDGPLDTFRSLFGDERADYQTALQTHYGAGPRAGDHWSAEHVSRYAMVHPWEDWAETFAHFLHICDGLETAESFGLVVEDPARSFGRDAMAGRGSAGPEPSEGAEVGIGQGVEAMIERWLGLTVALNALSRTMGQDDLYPFVLSTPVMAKLDFVERLVCGQDRSMPG